MRQATRQIVIETRGKGLIEFTGKAVDFIGSDRFESGLLTVFCRHTSASLLIQENADPDVQADLKRFFERVAPESGDYIHTAEAPTICPRTSVRR